LSDSAAVTSVADDLKLGLAMNGGEDLIDKGENCVFDEVSLIILLIRRP